MKVIIDRANDYIAQDAKRLIAHHEEKRTEPLVASVKSAVTTWRCERCDSVFWATVDTYPQYCSKGCEVKSKDIGF